MAKLDNFKDRLIRAFPVWRDMLKRSTPFIRQWAGGGAAIGTLTVPGVKVGDELVGVVEVTATTAALVDRTSTFTITGDDELTGTADTSANDLIVTWISWQK